MWPTDAEALVEEQRRLATTEAPPWRPGPVPWSVGGCWVAFDRGLSGPGAGGNPAWAAAVVTRGERVVGQHVRRALATRPLAVHPGWRVDLTTAVRVIASVTVQRTPRAAARGAQAGPRGTSR
jgi:hypothetical protein